MIISTQVHEENTEKNTTHLFLVRKARQHVKGKASSSFKNSISKLNHWPFFISNTHRWPACFVEPRYGGLWLTRYFNTVKRPHGMWHSMLVYSDKWICTTIKPPTKVRKKREIIFLEETGKRIFIHGALLNFFFCFSIFSAIGFNFQLFRGAFSNSFLSNSKQFLIN